MFDIGFWEIALVAVVALLIVGPEEFPTILRNAGAWLGRARRFMSSIKTEFEQEINKAEEIKRLMEKEAEIARLHQTIDETKATVAIHSPSTPAQQQASEDHAAKTESTDKASGPNSSQS